MANENVEKGSVEQSSFDKQDVEVAEKFCGIVGRGLAFLVHAGVETGNHIRETFVKVAESKPEVAISIVKAVETVELARLTTTVKLNEMSAALMTAVIDGTFTLVGKVVDKVDVGRIIEYSMESDKANHECRLIEANAERVKQEAKAKVIEIEAAARLLEAQNDAKRQERYEQERRVN